jgi:hypothetical protein
MSHVSHQLTHNIFHFLPPFFFFADALMIPINDSSL